MKKKYTKIISFFLKALILIAFIYYLSIRIEPNKLIKYLKDIKLSLFFIAVLLFILGKSLNILKWRFIVKRNTDATNYEIIASMFGGYTLSIITPGRLGEMGRFLFIKNVDSREIISYTALDKIFNITINVFLGLFIFIFFPLQYSTILKIIVFFIAFVIFAIIICYIFIPKRIYYLLMKVPYLRKKKNKKFIKILKESNIKDNFLIFLFSISTYFFFLVEFVFLSLAFNLNAYAVAAKAFMVSLFLKTVLPITIAEWGIKEISLMEYFSLEGFSSEIALAAAFFLYLINIILPSIVGLFFVLKEGVYNGRKDK
ncbi:MAG: hypothetical protein FXF47_06850 [Candidatus Mcinerneyibacterium aminivorans]|uniref:Flippase-like domain-containing protein n=1 Tax=Candidatus Mcinerneyibacterium aminivorans TaxID=2703815 RepID=A0A5D0MG69_9BACT|nr:MAG: hypothetical protein FXF47_06850 [Candidatus Mcinerneyibacterium aminivorans]